HVDAALTCAVEQFARPIGEEIVFAALQQGNIRTAPAAFTRQQGGGCRDRRGIADSDMTDASDQPRDHVGEQLLVAVSPLHAVVSNVMVWLVPAAGRSTNRSAEPSNPSAGEGPAIHAFLFLRSKTGIPRPPGSAQHKAALFSYTYRSRYSANPASLAAMRA